MFVNQFIVKLFGVSLCFIAVKGFHNDNFSNEQKSEIRRTEASNIDHILKSLSYHIPNYIDKSEENRYLRQILMPIYKALEEITDKLTSLPMMPSTAQPIYVPIPLYLNPQLGNGVENSYGSTNSQIGPNVVNRYPVEIEPNQNWGIVVEEEDNAKSDGEILPPKSLKSEVEAKPACNCSFAEEAIKNNATSTLPPIKDVTVKTPFMCYPVIIYCCGPGNSEQKRKDCFTEQGCTGFYETKLACLPAVIKAVFSEMYGKI